MALAGGCSPSSPLQLKPKAHDDGDCEQNEDESHVLDLVPAEALLQLVKKKKKGGNVELGAVGIRRAGLTAGGRRGRQWAS